MSPMKLFALLKIAFVMKTFVCLSHVAVSVKQEEGAPDVSKKSEEMSPGKPTGNYLISVFFSFQISIRKPDLK